MSRGLDHTSTFVCSVPSATHGDEESDELRLRFFALKLF